MSKMQLSVQDARLWLLGITTTCVALHLTLAWRLETGNLLSNSLLFWTGAGYGVWLRRSHLPFPVSPCNLLGLLPIAFVLLRSWILPNPNFLMMAPLLSGVGLALLASGLGGLRQFWKELVILSALAWHALVTFGFSLEISVYTARVASFLLWYAGQPVMLEGALLHLNQGVVNVAGGCSGIEQIFHLLGIAVMALLVFPVRARVGGWMPGVAIAIAFGVNALRVCLMTLLVSVGNQAGFEYWHDGNGSLIFSMVSVGLFGWIYSGLGGVEPMPELVSESKTQRHSVGKAS